MFACNVAMEMPVLPLQRIMKSLSVDHISGLKPQSAVFTRGFTWCEKKTLQISA